MERSAKARQPARLPDEGTARASEPDIAEDLLELNALLQLDSVGIATIDPLTARCLRVSRGMTRLTGWSEQELLRKTLIDLTHPEDRSRDRAVMQQAMERGAAGWSSEKRLLRCDGTVVWLRVSGRFIRDIGGRPWRAVATFEEIAVQDAAEHEAERRFQEMADALPQIVYLCDPDGRVRSVNRRWFEYTGLSPESCAPSDWAVAVHPEDAPALPQWWREVSANRRPHRGRFRLRRADGTYRWFLACVEPRFDSAGGLVGWAGISIDIHDQVLLTEALAHSKERFETALSGITDAFAMFDREWRYVFVNAQWSRLNGRAADEVLGQRLWDVFPEFLHVPAFEALRQTVAEQRSFRIEYFSPVAQRWLETRAYPTASGISLFNTEIHERKLAQQAVGNQQKWLEEVLNSIPVPLTLIEPDTGRVFFANAAADRLAGGHVQRDVPIAEYDRHHSFTDEQDRPLSSEATPPARLARGDVLRNEVAVWHIPAGRFTILINGNTLPEMFGHPATVVSTFQDIGELRRAEAELERSLALMNTFLGSAPVGMAFLDRELRCVLANQVLAKDTGATMEALRGRTTAEIAPELAPQIVPMLESVLRTGEPVFSREVAGEIGSDPGRRRSWVMSCYPVRSTRDGALLGVGAVVIENTAYKEAQEKLEEAVRARNVFFSVASHELRTPITGLKLQVQMARRARDQGDGTLPPERVARLIDQADRALARLTRLVDDMLDISRIQNGRLALQLDRFDLRRIFEETLDRFSTELAAAGIALDIGMPESIEGTFDRFRIEQVLTNLVTNAIRYAPGGPLRLRLRRDGDRAVAEVRDSGPGIAPEHHERIFERFERLGLRTAAGGLGLGLYIVREILAAHGGSIRLESEPGQGAAFIFQVPLAASA